MRRLARLGKMADNLKSLIKTKQATKIITENSTEVVCSNFGNRLFIIVTQYGKIGTLVNISKEIGLIDSEQAETLDIKVLFGKDEPVTHVFAKQIASSIYKSGILQPILLGIALKDQSPATLKKVIELINENSVW